MMIVDHYAWRRWPYFSKRKADVLVAFADFLADINAQGIPSIVECLRSNNDTSEFVKSEFVETLNSCGIRREHTPVTSPKHGGVVERQIAMTLELSMTSCLEPPVCSASRRCHRQGLSGLRRVHTPARVTERDIHDRGEVKFPEHLT